MSKKKLVIILGSVCGVVVLVILVILLIQLLGNRNLSYAQIEERMIDAATNYVSDNENLFSEGENEFTVSVDTLVSGEYMNALGEYTESSCTGSVTITNNNGIYFYTPNLNCGDSYHTVFLADYIKENSPLDDDGSGLYELNGEYVFRGEWPLNQLSFADQVWRIIKITENNEIVAMSTTPIENVAWDDRYNVDTNHNDGVNNYTISRVKDQLDSYYETFSDKEKAKLFAYDACIGKRNSSILTQDNSSECSQTLPNVYVSLITLSDALNVSLDSNCNLSSYSCQNYNYIARIFSDAWTITANDKSTYRVYYIDNGTIWVEDANERKNAYPVIHLQPGIRYISGNGRGSNPYVVE